MENKTDANLVRNINTHGNIRGKKSGSCWPGPGIMSQDNGGLCKKKDALFEDHDREVRTWGTIVDNILL